MTPPALPLSVDNLVVRAASGRVLLAVGRLRVAPGEAVVVRGPSGAGKSTLLYALAGLIRPDEGAVCWGETDISTLSDPARAEFRRRNLGIIFQEHHLLEELSALGNASVAAAYAPRAERAELRAAASGRLGRLGLTGAQLVSTLSGGERQRVAVARALSANPTVILADEPTASLDRSNADALIDDLLALTREADHSLIAVSHDEAFHARADRVLSLRDGRLADA